MFICDLLLLFPRQLVRTSQHYRPRCDTVNACFSEFQGVTAMTADAVSSMISAHGSFRVDDVKPAT
jgi:hypothetical protein